MLISEENAWTAISKKGPLVTSSSLLRSLAMEQRRTWFQDAFGKHRKTVRTHFKQLLPDGAALAGRHYILSSCTL